MRRLFRLPATRQSLERDVDEEIRFHLERRVEDLVRQGHAPNAARETAEREYGDRAESRAELVRVDRRRFERTRRRGVLDALRQDLGFAARSLRARPGFTIAVALTFGLGLGVNAAMFEVVDRLLFRPPPFLHEPSTVNRVYVSYTYDGRDVTDRSLEYTRYLDFRRWTTRFAQAAAFASREMAVGDGADAREMRVDAVSADFFAFFDVRPQLGRFFTAREDTVPVGASVAVASDAFWRTRFGGRPDVLGQTVRVGTELYTIVGVAPKGFVGVGDDAPPQLFIPITTFAGTSSRTASPSEYYTTYSWGWMQMLLRRRPGVTPEAASADLTSAYERSWAAQRAQEPGLAPTSVAHPHALAGPIAVERGPLASATAKVAAWLGGVALIVLLVACANVANLLLARTLGRRREMTMRLALGAGRSRVLSMLLAESLLLALLGGAVGVLAAEVGGAALRTLFLPEGAPGGALGDARTLLVVAATALAAGVATGLAPALGVRDELAAALRAGDRGGTARRSRARTALLVFQGALSVVLLVGAGLFVRSLGNVRALRLGFDVDPLLYVTPSLRGARLSPAERAALEQRLLEAARATPGVSSAAYAASVPLMDHWGQSFEVPGVDSVRRLGRFTVQASGGDFFRTTGTRIVRGRPITDDDRAGAPMAVVVSEGMARVLWPGRDPLGQCIRVRYGGKAPVECSTVVGVAENIKQTGLTDDQGLQYYLSRFQMPNAPRAGFFVRARGDDARPLAEAVRRRMQALMPGAGYVTVTPMREIVDPRMQSWRAGATLFVAFGGLALLVAAIGLYSVIAYDVARRTRDIGVRLALGARAGAVLRVVLGEGLRLAAVGVAIGGVCALLAARRVAPLLYGESPTDPLVYGGVAAVLLLVAAAASALPALRASRVDPSTTLRAE